MKFISVIGGLLAIVYGYLRWNTDGYWFVIPFVLLMFLLFALEE